MMTLEEAKNQLATVQAAIQQLLEGKRLTQLKVGSGNFSRLYEYQELTLENLKNARDELLDVIDTFEGNEPRFKLHSTIPLVVGKDIY